MKTIKIILLLFFFLNINYIFAETWIKGQVIKVIDGDTITLLAFDKKQLKVRLAEIDAPEKGQAYSAIAQKALSSFIFKKKVNVLVFGTDRYNRLIGTIYLGNVNINKIMVKHGYAWAYRFFIKDNEYILLENYARDNKIGLWKDHSPIEPYLFRKNKK